MHLFNLCMDCGQQMDTEVHDCTSCNSSMVEDIYSCICPSCELEQTANIDDPCVNCGELVEEIDS